MSSVTFGYSHYNQGTTFDRYGVHLKILLRQTHICLVRKKCYMLSKVEESYGIGCRFQKEQEGTPILLLRAKVSIYREQKYLRPVTKLI